MLQAALVLSCLSCCSNGQQRPSHIAGTVNPEEALIDLPGDPDACANPSTCHLVLLQSRLDIIHNELRASMDLNARNRVIDKVGDVSGKQQGTRQLFVIHVEWREYILGAAALGLIMGILCIASICGIADKKSESAITTETSKSSHLEHPRKRLAAIEVFRLLGVIHILFYHFNPPSTNSFNQWGSCWLTFFFALSGFGAAYGKLTNPGYVSSVWPQPGTLFRRWASIYPSYFIAIVFSAIQYVQWHWEIEVSSLVMELAMFPVLCIDDNSKRLNYFDWFPTWLVLCWLAEILFFQVANSCWQGGSQSRAILAWSCIMAWAWLLIVREHWDRFNPLMSVVACEGVAYILSYFCGILVAHCVAAECFKKTWFCKTSASFSFCTLVSIVALTDAPSSIRKFILLPLMCLVLYGFGMERDPLTSLFASVPSRVSEFSLEIYLLQLPVHRLYGSFTTADVSPIGYTIPTQQMFLKYVLVLCCIAGVVHVLVRELMATCRKLPSAC